MKIEEISIDIWAEFKNNPCIETRNYILMHYVQLVKEIAGRLVPTYKNYFDFDDLYSSGILGLMDAIEKFDINKNIKFETYASWRVKGAIIDQIRKLDWLPRSMRKKIKDVEDAYRNIEKGLGREPTDKEVANYLGISVDEMEKILSDSYTYQVISMDEHIMGVMDIDDIFSDNNATPEKSYEGKELKYSIEKAIDKLTENERTVVSLYYFDELNQKEISKAMDISESRVSQLHSKALIKIKLYIEKYNLVEKV